MMWLKPRTSWGPIPSPRSRPISWVVEDRQIFLYGGQLESNIEKDDAIYSLDTKLLTWSEWPTKGESPPLTFRLPPFATVSLKARRLFNFALTYEGSPERVTVVTLYTLNLDTLEWTKEVMEEKHNTKHGAVGGLAVAFTDNILFHDPNEETLIEYGGVGPTGNYAITMIKSFDYSTHVWTKKNWSLLPPYPLSKGVLAGHLDDNNAPSSGGLWFSGGARFEYANSIDKFNTDFVVGKIKAESGTRFSFNLVQLPVNVTGYLKKRRNHASCVAPTSDGYSKLFIYGGTYQLGASVPSEDDLPFFLYDEKDKAFEVISMDDPNCIPLRSHAAMQVADDRLYIFGGEHNVSHHLMCDLGILALEKRPADSFDTAHRILHGLEVTQPQHRADLIVLPDNPNATTTASRTKDEPLLKLKPTKEEKFKVQETKPSKLRQERMAASSSATESSSSSGSGSDASERYYQRPQPLPVRTAPPKVNKNAGMNPMYQSIQLEPLPVKKGPVAVKKSTPSKPIGPIQATLRTNEASSTVNGDEKRTENPLASAVNNLDTYPDVEFKLRDRTIFSHKIVLSSGSQVFLKKFDSGVKSPESSKRHGADDDDTVRSDSSLSTWGPTDGTKDVIKLPDYWDYDSFLAVLGFFYTGSITITKENTYSVSEIAFEYLLDELMKLCDTSKEFPVNYEIPPKQMLRRFKRCVGNPIGSDISFVFNRKSRLFAHKVFLHQFSSYFRPQLDSNSKLKYIEIKEPEISIPAFTDYLKLLYNGFAPSAFDSKMDVQGLFSCSLAFKDSVLLQMMVDNCSFSVASVGSIWAICLENNLESLQYSAEKYILDNFAAIAREGVMKAWPPQLLRLVTTLLVEEKHETWSSFASWLDVLWLSYHIEEKHLKSVAVQKLGALLNVENVVAVLVGAHAAGEKELRSKCLDFILLKGVGVAEYQHMKCNKVKDLSTIYKLSDSVKSEIEGKVKQTVKALPKNSPSPVKKPSFVLRQKNKCALCKRVMEKQNLSKELLPPVFGSKLKVICFSCKQLSVLVEPPKKPDTPSSSGSLTSTSSNASFASSNNTNNNESKISI